MSRLRISLLLSLALLALPCFADVAAATPLLPASVPLELDLEDEAEDEAEIAEDECASAEAELEAEEPLDGEADEICRGAAEETAGGASSDSSSTCALQSAKAHAVAKGAVVKLTIGYTTAAAAKATIAIRYGPTRLGPFKRRLGHSGVLRFTAKIDGPPARKRIVVLIRTASAGSAGCPSRRLAVNVR